MGASGSAASRVSPASGTQATPTAGSMALPTSPAARRLGAPRWRDGRLLAGIVLVLASVAIGARLLSTGGSKTQLLAARAGLSAGHVLTDADLSTSAVALDARQRADYLLAAERQAVVGKTLTRPVGAGELLPAGAVVTDASTTTAEASLSVRDGRHPALDAGDRVDVYATTEAPAAVPAGAATPAGSGGATAANPAAVCTTVLVAAGLEVVSAVPTDADGAAATVILRVPPGQAGALVHAGEAGDIDLVRDPRVGPASVAGAAAPGSAAVPTSAPLQGIGPVAAGACATGK